MYRLHIDIPLDTDEETAISVAKQLMDWYFIDVDSQEKIQRCEYSLKTLVDSSISLSQINYRLGHDEDRQKSNYLMKNEEGHVNNKKCRLTFNDNNV